VSLISNFRLGKPDGADNVTSRPEIHLGVQEDGRERQDVGREGLDHGQGTEEERESGLNDDKASRYITRGEATREQVMGGSCLLSVGGVYTYLWRWLGRIVSTRTVFPAMLEMLGKKTPESCLVCISCLVLSCVVPVHARHF